MRKYGNYELSIIFVKKRDWASVTRSDSKLKALKGAFNYFLVGKADCVCTCGVPGVLFSPIHSARVF